MTETKTKLKKQRFALREPAKPLQERPDERPLDPNHPAALIYAAAQAPAQGAADEPSTDSHPYERLTSQPVNQPMVDQLTSLDNQLTSSELPRTSTPLVNQSTSLQQSERFYPSRRDRKLKGTRLPVNKIEKYELWCLLNKVDFQEAVEYALDWLTSQPVNQLTGQPANQLTTLINSNLNNESVINDEKAVKVFAKYTELTGKPITLRDKDAYREVSHLDYGQIEQGLLTALARATKAGNRVNSFKYALNCIREAKPTTDQQSIAMADYSQCLDCSGSGFWYPEGVEKGVAKCRHERLSK